MKTVNTHEAKTHLSQLLELVEQGEEILIARAGKPVARLTRICPRREPGYLNADYRIDDGFDREDAQIADDFLDSPLFPG